MEWEIIGAAVGLAVLGLAFWGIRDRADRVRRAASVGAVIEMAPPLRRSRATGVLLVLGALGLLVTLVLAERTLPADPPAGPDPTHAPARG